MLYVKPGDGSLVEVFLQGSGKSFYVTGMNIDIRRLLQKDPETGLSTLIGLERCLVTLRPRLVMQDYIELADVRLCECLVDRRLVANYDLIYIAHEREEESGYTVGVIPTGNSDCSNVVWIQPRDNSDDPDLEVPNSRVIVSGHVGLAIVLCMPFSLGHTSNFCLINL
jgi:hypothetical protein